MADNESLERALTLEPTKRKRSSILKQPDKRSRDSRTVSFNDKYYYKELYQDGTFFLGEDMDITTMDIVDPENQTIDKSADMSMDQTMVTQSMNLVTHDDILQNSQIMATQSVHMVTHNNDISHDLSQNSQVMEISTLHAPPTPQQAKGSPTSQLATSSPNSSQLAKGSPNSSQLAKGSPNSSQLAKDSPITQLTQVSPISQLAQFSQISEISSLDDTLFGAFHDSNNLSMLSSNRTSGLDTLMHNIDALNECIQKVDHESDECRRKLDAEIQDLFRFYRHIVNKNDEYEFAVAIFGLRHSLWLIIKIDPETYPNEKLKLRFAVKKQDTHLYPFKEYAEAVRRYTKEGSYGYLARFVINAQRFRRFLRKIGYKKPNP